MDLLSLLYLLAFACSGVFISELVFAKDKPVRRIFFGLVFGLAMLLWLPTLFAFLFDFTLLAQMLALAAAVGAGCVCFVISRRRIRSGRLKFNKSKPENLKALLWTIIPLVAIGCILHINHTIVTASDGSLHVGQCTYGDLCMHLGFISSISVQKTFPPNYSILPGTPLGYPFLCDSVSSTFYTLGASLRFAALLPALYAYLIVVLGVYLFFESWFKRGSVASFATYLFFIGGGLGFAYIFNNKQLLAADGIDRFKELLEGFYRTPTNIPEEGLRWVNTIADMLVPQRATLFGWALLFPCLQLLYRAAMEREKRLFIPLGVLAGCLPLVHTHSFLALGMISLFLLVGFAGKYLRGAVNTPRARVAVPVFGMALAVLLFGFIGGRTNIIAVTSATEIIPTILATVMAVVFGLITVKCVSDEYSFNAAPAGSLRLFGIVCFFGVVVSSLLIFCPTGNSSLANLIGIVLAAATAVYMVFTFMRGNPNLKYDPAASGHLIMFVIFGVIAVVLAAPQLLGFTFKQSVGSQFTRWNFNWDNTSDSWLWFYIKNLGLIFIFMFPAFFAASRRTKVFYGGGLLIWFVCEFILFQPNPYDNNKLLFVWFALTCGLVAEYLIKLFNKLTEAERSHNAPDAVKALDTGACANIPGGMINFEAVRSDDENGEGSNLPPHLPDNGEPISSEPTVNAELQSDEHGSSDTVSFSSRLAPRIIACFVLVALFLSGALTLMREYVSADHVDGFKYVESGYTVVSAPLVKLADFVKKNTEPDATFLTYNNHNNAIAMLTGRNIFCGSGTFLFYHGVNYLPRQEMLPLLYEHPADTLYNTAKEYGIDYVLISEHENAYNIDRAWFDTNLECVYSDSGIKLYRITEAAGNGSSGARPGANGGLVRPTASPQPAGSDGAVSVTPTPTRAPHDGI